MRVPAAIEGYVCGLHLVRRLGLEYAARAERERCGNESEGSKGSLHRYFNAAGLHRFLHFSALCYVT
jgi:hypothetical protein